MPERSVGLKGDKPQQRKARPSSAKNGGVKAQHARFLDAAREAGADVDTDVADRLMGRLAETKPVAKPKPKSVKTTRDA